MKLYIPPYLRTGKIPVLKQLYEMVASYSEEYTDKEELDSFNDYKASLINDPVLLFLDYCVPSLEDMKIKYPLEENLDELNYLTGKGLDEINKKMPLMDKIYVVVRYI